MSHTPAPWKVGQKKQIDFPIETTRADGMRIVVARVPDTNKVDAAANAALIAAAPDLFKALEAFEKFHGGSAKDKDLDPDISSHKIILDARAAIAKAKGES